ncbi:MAG TPA: amino acid adenylation domain-containing protein [Pyrinomonadaceae bacterium]|nr:amino acid adenylation domain-containing protein [Pyrinomonadaceae bacterium]
MYDYNLAIRFEAAVSQHGDRTALWFSADERASYAELNRIANRIARFLSARGVKEEDVVSISGNKSVVTFASMIASLKLGCPYVMLDPDSPAERLRKILSTCRPRVLLIETDLANRLAEIASELAIELIDKKSVVDQVENSDNLAETRSVTGSNPAYIMFTSGSTGFPKGAVMTHTNVLNLIDWATETFAITSDDVLTNVNPLYFDNSVFDFYAALFTGASLVPLSKDETSDPKLLVDKIDEGVCTLWFSVPSLLMFLQTMRATDGKHLRSIRRFIFGGEGYPKAKLKALYDAYAPAAEFFNVYGPTECTCICSSYRVTEDDFQDLQGLPPLGHIAANFDYLIIDGELCLLGPNVGRGYYNDPERTAQSFVQNPRHEKFIDIMYRTGDLVRLNPADGKLYIEGRKDNQIKHMGYRIELEEIEAALHCLDYVSEAAVLHTNANGLSRIVAVVAAIRDFDNEQIRGDLKQIVPNYMVPSVFHREKMLPKNPNGKVDRRKLAEKYVRNGAS